MDYTEFRAQYETHHPASVPVLRYEANVYPSWVKWAVLAMFIAAAVISGVHTIPTVHQSIEADKVATWVRDAAALLSFVAVELAILLSAYLLIRNAALGWLILIVTFIVAIVANLQSSMAALTGKDDWTRVVAIVLGAGAPLIVLMSGKLLVSIFQSERAISSGAEKRYREECRVFDADVLAAYEKFSRSKRSLPPAATVQSVHSLNSVNGSVNKPAQLSHSVNSASGYTKRMDSRAIIREFFTQYPDAMNDKLDELVERIEQQTGAKVGRTSIHNVRSELMKQGVSGGKAD